MMQLHAKCLGVTDEHDCKSRMVVMLVMQPQATRFSVIDKHVEASDCAPASDCGSTYVQRSRGKRDPTNYSLQTSFANVWCNQVPPPHRPPRRSDIDVDVDIDVAGSFKQIQMYI
jgi:hypothetical protein